MNNNRLTVVAPISLLFISAVSSADPVPSWVQSYAVGDQCFCSNSVSESSVAASTIVPTPVGGQSVAQVCGRVGNGPSLLLENQQFNYPVYADAQCGNGPTLGVNPVELEGCVGVLAVDNSVCLGIGPSWDLQAAFAKPSSTNGSSLANSNVEQIRAVIVVPEKKPDRQPVDSSQPTTIADLVNQSEDQVDPISDSQPSSIAELLDRTEPYRDTGTATVLEESPARVETVASVVKPDTADEPINATDVVQARSDKPLAQTYPLLEETETAEVMRSEEPVETIVESPVAEVVTPVEESDPKLSAAKPDLPSPHKAPGWPFRSSPRHKGYRYLQVSPVGYDYGGNGAAVEGSFSPRSAWRLFGRAAVTEDYEEFKIGAGYALAINSLPKAALHIGFGVEHGNFDLGLTDYDSSGAFLSTTLGYQFTNQLNFAAGISYSSFFEGDPSVFGLGIYQLMKNIDLSGRVEAGDNDNVGIGLRFNY